MTEPIAPSTPLAPADVTTDVDPTAVSPAMAKFLACRWHKADGPDGPAHCTQPSVRSMAGTAGFNAESWCPDCEYFKVRRGAKRPPGMV